MKFTVRLGNGFKGESVVSPFRRGDIEFAACVGLIVVALEFRRGGNQLFEFGSRAEEVSRITLQGRFWPFVDLNVDVTRVA